jgi:hypothetical protein
MKTALNVTGLPAPPARLATRRFAWASGQMLGADQPINLLLLEITAAPPAPLGHPDGAQ